ncbi:MAG: hypothetical protein MK160_01015 [Rhodobacteraceae bacterium]|nr:hypothetical protein [Paracoccaceae bacterium]
MFCKDLLFSGFAMGAMVLVGGCMDAGSVSVSATRQAPMPQPLSSVGRGGFYQDANGCFAVEDPNGNLRQWTASSGNPVCE